MDKTISQTLVEKTTETKPETQTEKLEEMQVEKLEEKQKEVVLKEAPPANAHYLSNFENLTVADVKKEEQLLQEQQAKEQREQLLEEERLQQEEILQEQQEEPQKQVLQQEKCAKSTNVIEKPNWDLLEENKKVVKLKNHSASKKVKKKKTAALVLALALGGCGALCVTNTIILDQMNSSFLQLEDTYHLNLQRYLQNISNLDATKKSMEMVETYPEELLDAGDLGKKTNWFDKLCNFLGGLFGG